MNSLDYGGFKINPYPPPPGFKRIRKWWISYGGQRVGPRACADVAAAMYWIDTHGGKG